MQFPYQTIEALPGSMDVFTPAEYAELYAREADNIEKVVFKPYPLGSGKIGGIFIVKFKRPISRAHFKRTPQNGNT